MKAKVKCQFTSSLVFSMVLVLICSQTIYAQTETDLKQGAEVICIHDLQIKPGVDEKEFEFFVMDEIAPLYNRMKGQNLYLTKGDRGVRYGQYAIIITFTSIEDRDRIYPPVEGFSEEFNQIMEGKDAIWEKFSLMAEGFDGMNHTDYVKIHQ